jgi:flagellar hook-associated protein 3 FlgL
MRVSTLHLFQQGINAIQEQQAKLQQTELQLATGLRFNKPSEDPAAAVKALDLTAKIAAIAQYGRNSTIAQATLAFEESVIVGVQNNLQRIRELVIQGNNAATAGTARQNIAQEIYQRLDELVALANTRDAQGDYIFGGFRVSSPPFVQSGTGVVYQGDQGQRLLQVGDGAQIVVQDNGEDVFQSMPTGDGYIQVVADPGNTGTAIVGSFGLDGNFLPDTYTVTFSQPTPASPTSYAVTDGSAAVIQTGTYQEGSSISFAGAQFTLTGTPADGDSVVLSPSVKQDLFATVKALADALAGVSPDATGKARFHNEVNRQLSNLDQGLEKITSIRAGIGARLNNIETLDDINQDFKLQLQTTLSETRDLDFIEAISRFNLQLTSLQAAQQAYISATGLTLFNYL